MQLLLPMAGRGSRFSAAGYTTPKPFLPVQGQPMLRRVIEDVTAFAGPIESVLALSLVEHGEWTRGFEDVEFIPVGSVTGGAACTVLLAEPWLDPEEPLIVANCDQRFRCLGQLGRETCSVLTFRSQESKWSYLTETGRIVEKPRFPPSQWATVGVYCFRRAGDLFDAIVAMMEAGDTTNGEYYLAPAINYLPAGSRVRNLPVSEMHGLGTPEDYENYLASR